MRARTVTAHLDAAPEAVFRMLIDPARLPVWNSAVRRVLDAPSSLSDGAEWVVEMHALGQSWPSRARVLELDPAGRVFRYRACTDDGNPSYTVWSWRVTPAQGGGSEVSVSWELNPKTFWRRVLLGRIRQRQLQRGEVPASLCALGATAQSASPVS